MFSSNLALLTHKRCPPVFCVLATLVPFMGGSQSGAARCLSSALHVWIKFGLGYHTGGGGELFKLEVISEHCLSEDIRGIHVISFIWWGRARHPRSGLAGGPSHSHHFLAALLLASDSWLQEIVFPNGPRSIQYPKTSWIHSCRNSFICSDLHSFFFFFQFYFICLLIFVVSPPPFMWTHVCDSNVNFAGQSKTEDDGQGQGTGILWQFLQTNLRREMAFHSRLAFVSIEVLRLGKQFLQHW